MGLMMTLHKGNVLEWNPRTAEKCYKALKNNQIWSTKQGINPWRADKA